MNRVTFYDPLYDFVSFEEAEAERQRDFFDPGFSTSPVVSSSKSLRPFLGTPEFSRLAFLRQSDLGFLVYPSATHTRFAHAVGCCYLGYIAAREIIIGIRAKTPKNKGKSGGRAVSTTGSKSDKGDRQIFLSKWLEEKGWKEEFLLALLLHDIGHFAFSHALENNLDLWEVLGEEISHEDVAGQFITGEGIMADVFRRRWKDLQGYSFISDLIRQAPEIDAGVTKYLISGNEAEIGDREPSVRSAIKMLHELTSGLLDLDRIDHYRRDSYFSGMKFASNLNFSSLLNGFTIWYVGDEDGFGHEIRLSKEAIGHALTLLHAKERLVHDCFENVDNLAYEVMLHQAFNLHVFGDEFYTSNLTSAHLTDLARLRDRVFELLLSTDEELLLTLERGNSKVRRIIHRIRNRRPFLCLGRRALDQRGFSSPGEVRNALAELSGISQDEIVIRVCKGFGRSRKERPLEWLHLDSLNDDQGYPLETHDEYMRQIQHFKRVQEDGGNVFWLFTPSEEAAVQDRLKVALAQFVSRPG